MTRQMLLHRLAAVERHIKEGECHVKRQREIVEALERHGRGQSETATVARQLLHSYEVAQATHVADRERLLERLIEAAE